jgi:nucleotide-binding universal stress UspA family protein
MFQRILVPVDLSERSWRPVAMAVRMAASMGGAVSLLHVIETIADSSPEELGAFYAEIEQDVTQRLVALSTPHQDAAITLEHVVVYGNRVQEIIRVAVEQAIDLIIMNSHRLDINDPALGWETISYKVSALADCPVLLVK